MADADGEPGERHGADRVGWALVVAESNIAATGPLGEVATQVEHPSKESRWEKLVRKVGGKSW